MVRSLEDLREEFAFHLFPGRQYFQIYAETGLLAAGLALPTEYLFTTSRYQHTLRPNTVGVRSITASAPDLPVLRFLSNVAPGFVARAGTRFLAYGQFIHIRDVKREMGTNRWPRWLDIGASGAAAGLVETVVAHRFSNPTAGFPPMIQLVRQPAKLLICFGTFGYLSNKFTNFPQCLSNELSQWSSKELMEILKGYSCASIAGAVGNTICSAAEGLRGPALGVSALRGAVVTGLIITAQVGVCSEALREMRRQEQAAGSM